MKKLTHTLLVISFSTLTVFGQIPLKGLVAYYPFSGDANDYSSNSNDGIITGSTLVDDRFGNPNSAYSFINSNDKISISSLNENNILQYSITGWFKKNSSSIGNEGCIFSGSNPLITNGLRLHVGSDNNIAFGAEYTNGSVWSNSKNQNYADDIWHFFTVIYNGTSGSVIDSTQLRIIIDNVEISKVQKVWGSQSNVKSPINNQNIGTVIGNVPNGTDNFKGLLDDIRIFNRVLTSSEITALYNENSCSNYTSKIILPDYINTNGLIAYYPLNNDTKDYSGNNYDGINNGATPTTDRFGNIDKAYQFDGISNQITFNNLFVFNQSGDATITMWLKPNTPPSNIQGTFLKSSTGVADANRFNFFINPLTADNSKLNLDYRETNSNIHILNNYSNFTLNNWHNVTYTRKVDVYSVYIDGLLINVSTDNSPKLPNSIGWVLGNDPSSIMDYKGSIDDVKIYTRALDQNEISELFSENVCVSNITVTDTLKISAISGINELPENFGLVKVYPNPTKDVINIVASNPSNNYSIQIANNIGTIVYTSAIINASTQVNLNTSLGSKGMYFIKILDDKNNVLDTRKLVLE